MPRPLLAELFLTVLTGSILEFNSIAFLACLKVALIPLKRLLISDILMVEKLFRENFSPSVLIGLLIPLLAALVSALALRLVLGLVLESAMSINLIPSGFVDPSGTLPANQNFWNCLRQN